MAHEVKCTRGTLKLMKIFIYFQNYIHTSGQKYKTTLKNEGKDTVYNFFNYENQIYER